jgi:uncharacterized membrane protein
MREGAEAQRELNSVVHRALTVGLGISIVFFLAGLSLALVRNTSLPDRAVSPTEAFRQMVALQPTGFLSMGLITLLGTPILRVVGSIVVFTKEGDWLFVGVTATVLLVMAASIVLGHG